MRFLYAAAASVLCPHRVPPAHGTYVQSQQTKTDWRERDVARFECNSGYAMVGDQRSTCSGHGHWKTDVPTCRRKYRVVYFVVNYFFMLCDIV